MRQSKHAAFRIFDVLAENYTPRIFFESKTQRLVHRVADPIFARRQNFLVDLRHRAGHIRGQLVRRRIFGLFGFGELAPDPLFNFVVDLGELVSGQQTFSN